MRSNTPLCRPLLLAVITLLVGWIGACSHLRPADPPDPAAIARWHVETHRQSAENALRIHLWHHQTAVQAHQAAAGLPHSPPPPPPMAPPPPPPPPSPPPSPGLQ